jgi:flagellar biosynthesis component FlhA
MENTDYLMRQIEGLNVLFRKLFSKISLLKEGAATDIQVAEINDLLKDALGINLDDIANSTNEELLEKLLKKKISISDLNKLISVIADLAKISDQMATGYRSDRLLARALFLEGYLEKTCNIAYYDNLTRLDKSEKS